MSNVFEADKLREDAAILKSLFLVNGPVDVSLKSPHNVFWVDVGPVSLRITNGFDNNGNAQIMIQAFPLGDDGAVVLDAMVIPYEEALAKALPPLPDPDPSVSDEAPF